MGRVTPKNHRADRIRRQMIERLQRDIKSNERAIKAARDRDDRGAVANHNRRLRALKTELADLIE